MNTLLSLSLIAAAGFFFMLTNLVMKVLGHTPFYILYPAIALTFALGAVCEVQALKQAQLGSAVTFILACELLFSIVIAFLFLRESYSLSNVFGIALVVLGISLVQMPAGNKAASAEPKPASAEGRR